MKWNKKPAPVLRGGELRTRRPFAWSRTEVGGMIVWLERYEVKEMYFSPSSGAPGWWREIDRYTLEPGY